MPGHLVDSELLSRLVDIQNELISAEPDLETLMTLVAHRSQELSNADGAAVELAEGTDMVYRAVSGLASGQLGLRIPRQGSYSGLCVERRELLVCEDSETCPGVNVEACRAVGLRSMVVQPLFRGDEIIGIVKVMWARPKGNGEGVPTVLNLLSRTTSGVLANALRWDEMKSHNDNLTHLASHDTMTGVRNRSAFYDALRQSIAQARRAGSRVGVALFDLDGLKTINDSLGHQAGDLYIRTFAERLARRVRESDTVARLGGDEFGVLFSLTDPSADPLRQGRVWADAAGGPVAFGEAELVVAASAGVAVYSEDGPDSEALVARADERLYADKRERRRS